MRRTAVDTPSNLSCLQWDDCRHLSSPYVSCRDIYLRIADMSFLMRVQRPALRRFKAATNTEQGVKLLIITPGMGFRKHHVPNSPSVLSISAGYASCRNAAASPSS